MQKMSYTNAIKSSIETNLQCPATSFSFKTWTCPYAYEYGQIWLCVHDTKMVKSAINIARMQQENIKDAQIAKDT